MNNNFNLQEIMIKCFAIFSCMMLLILFTSNASNNRSSVGKTMIYFSKTNKGKMNVQIKTALNKNVELYFFNSSGELVKKIETETKNVITVQSFEKGQYLYQCFEKDTQLKSGKLIVNQHSINYD